MNNLNVNVVPDEKSEPLNNELCSLLHSFSKICKAEFRVQGKAILSKTVTKTPIENQGETEFCWLYSLANVIVSSLWVRLRMLYFSVLNSKLIVGHVTDTGLKQAATDFLERKDLRQKLRRELQFGLFPKTLIGNSI